MAGTSFDPSKKALSLFEEFKKFAFKGNVIDLAVGVIIGAAFGKIITSLVDDILMPIIGKIVGDVDFSNIYIPLSSAIHGDMSYAEAKQVGAVIGIGQFLTIAVNFLIVAAALFIVIKQLERLKKAPAAAEPTKTEILLEQIRDSLRR
ncbi:MAG: large conductance mechanosensitive channel protein MscL [Methylocystis sp.]|nr:large conductance mechanosensitive channel protein MscL [Methylocystis sp.]